MAVKELRKEIMSKLEEKVIDRIRAAPKPTKVAEVLAVAQEMGNVSVNLGEVAEIINIAEPCRNIKAAAKDYSSEELKKHPSLLVTTTPQGCYVRHVGGRNIYEK